MFVKTKCAELNVALDIQFPMSLNLIYKIYTKIFT